MKIDELINSITEERTKQISASRGKIDPKIFIYMDLDYWHECREEITRHVPALAYEFFNKDTVMGYPVHRVFPSDTNRHPPFLISSGSNK